MPKTIDPLVKLARELSKWCPEDQARIAAIAAELYTAHGKPPLVQPVRGDVARSTAHATPVKRRGRKPGSKNKKKTLDEAYPKVIPTDSGVAQ